MKLLGTDGSPYVRKARVAIAEKGIACDYVTASPRDPDFRRFRRKSAEQGADLAAR